MIAQVGCVDDRQDRIRSPFTGLNAHDHVAGDRLVGRMGIKTVGAGQVDDIDLAAARQLQRAELSLHRDAGIIANFLPGTGQRVEQRGFSGVGIADQGDDCRHAAVFDSGRESTVISAASAGRSAMVILPTRIATGPPNGARCSNSTSTPSSKPISCSRCQVVASHPSRLMSAMVAGCPGVNWSMRIKATSRTDIANDYQMSARRDRVDPIIRAQDRRCSAGWRCRQRWWCRC